MNTAPNRRASDNASSPPGTSPTRRFSDMLKESSGSGSVLVIDDTNEKVDLTIADPSVPGELRNLRGIIVDTEMDIGTIVVEAMHYQDSTVVEYGVPNPWSCALASGVDPSLVFGGHYTFAGSRMVWVYIPTGGQHEPVAIIPPSFAKDLIPGTKKDPIT